MEGKDLKQSRIESVEFLPVQGKVESTFNNIGRPAVPIKANIKASSIESSHDGASEDLSSEENNLGMNTDTQFSDVWLDALDKKEFSDDILQ